MLTAVVYGSDTFLVKALDFYYFESPFCEAITILTKLANGSYVNFGCYGLWWRLKWWTIELRILGSCVPILQGTWLFSYSFF